MSWDWGQAQQAMNAAAAAQETSEQAMRDAGKEAADAERQYARALAMRMLEIKANGMAITVTERIAKGDEDISNLRYARDLKAAAFKAACAANYRHSANRADAVELAKWAMRRELADGSIGGDSRLSFSGGRAA